jgi:hypothetical protein
MTARKQTEDTLVITCNSEGGAPGIDSDPDNPLARALNSLLNTGRPIKRLSACYFDPLPMGTGLRWFGTFVYSDGDRLIYFPGLAEMHPSLQTSKSGGLINQQSFQVDHLSLEAHRRDWHLTTKGSTGHAGSYPTIDLGDGRVLWFGLSIASPDTLRLLRSSTKVEAQAHPNDSRRRAEVFMASRNGVVYNTLMFNTENYRPIAPSFAHFTVIAGPSGFADYFGEHHAFPFESPYISPKLPEVPLDIPAIRSHRISLEPHVDLQIITTVLPGVVTVPATFTSPVSPVV